MKRKILFLMLLTLMALLFAGCAMQTVEEMYALPKRSHEYDELQKAIDSAMDGLTYSAPQSGENRQTVQMADLDGDGVEEYLIFAAGTSDNPLQVLIFRQNENGTCSLMEIVDSNGSAFEQVEYVDFDDRPGKELVFGCKVSDQVLRSVSVYSFANGGAELLLLNGYSKFLTCDFDANGNDELMVLRPGEEESGRGVAVLYSCQGGQIRRSVETELSETPANIRRITEGKLHDDVPAVYIASATEENAIVTDIFALKDGRFTNISFSNEANTSVRTLRNFYIYGEDIDGDGVLELPGLITMKAVSPWEDEDQKFLLRWFALDSEGRDIDKLYTYHNYISGWYLQLDSAWSGRIAVAEEADSYTFYLWDESYREATPLFTVFVFTGADRDEEAVANGRFALHRSEVVAYAARLEPSAALYDITEEHLTDSFRLIRQDAQAGET